ncbi:MAG: hypothetical protein GC192_21375 [Bacteroidetes bacterium]|nr:hypothetical protein [Bacteroidota bacterium]
MKNLLQDLKHFTGSDQFYFHPLFPKFTYTEGVRYLAENAGAYWLLEYILSNQTDKKLRTEAFQAWAIQVKEDGSATLRVEDGNGNLVRRFKMQFTDFPFTEFSLWFIGGTLLLPSEY